MRALVALGLARGLLWLVAPAPAQFVLIQLLASPLPLVFDRPEYFATYTLTLASPGREAARLTLTREAMDRLRGPMARSEALPHAMAWAPLMPEDLRAALHCRLLSEPGDFAAELGLPRGASSITISIESPRAPRQEITSVCVE